MKQKKEYKFLKLIKNSLISIRNFTINFLKKYHLSLLIVFALITGICLLFVSIFVFDYDPTLLSFSIVLIITPIAYLILYFQKEQHQKEIIKQETKNNNIEYLKTMKDDVNNYLEYLKSINGKEYNAINNENKKGIWKLDNQIEYLQNTNAKITNLLGQILSNEKESIFEEEKLFLRTNNKEDFLIILNNIYEKLSNKEIFFF